MSWRKLVGFDVRDWLRKRRARRVAGWSTQELGWHGETLAARFLKRQGLVIVAYQERDALGEIDLVAVHRRTIVFVEVKTRRSLKFGPPHAAVSERKQRKIIRAAERFLKRKHLENYPVRYDVVAVVWPTDGAPPRIRYFPAAFTAQAR